MYEPPAPDHAPAPEDDSRRRLVNRIIIAALLVAGLLGGLAMFEAIYAPPPKAVPAHPAAERAASQYAPVPHPVTQAVERRYALQMGVFSNVANTEDLRAKLLANGIPATLEARVHVGPFRTRQEVDIARARLNALGLDDGLLITTKK